MVEIFCYGFFSCFCAVRVEKLFKFYPVYYYVDQSVESAHGCYECDRKLGILDIRFLFGLLDLYFMHYAFWVIMVSFGGKFANFSDLFLLFDLELFRICLLAFVDHLTSFVARVYRTLVVILDSAMIISSRRDNSVLVCS